MALFHAALPRDGKAGTASLRYTGHYRPRARRGAALLLCWSGADLEAQRGDAALPRDGKAGTASLRYTGHYRPDATSVASLIICRSALAIEAQRGVASLANTARYGLRDAPCAALRWLRAAYDI